MLSWVNSVSKYIHWLDWQSMNGWSSYHLPLLPPTTPFLASLVFERDLWNRVNTSSFNRGVSNCWTGFSTRTWNWNVGLDLTHWTVIKCLIQDETEASSTYSLSYFARHALWVVEASFLEFVGVKGHMNHSHFMKIFPISYTFGVEGWECPSE